MLHQVNQDDDDCAIAHALSVIGDWWTLLVVRDIAGGIHRFDDLQSALHVSRKVLTERLKALVEDGVAERRQYRDRPARFEYHLTHKGQALLPVLIGLQDWGARYVMSQGELTATTEPESLEAARVHRLVGAAVPPITLIDRDGRPSDVVDETRRWTVVYCFPGAYADDSLYPPGWADLPGAPGCTLQAVTFRDRHADFVGSDAAVVGISTQRPDQLADLEAHHGLPFRLLSDQDLQLAASLRLPTFRAGGDRLKRLTLIIDHHRVVRQVLYPIKRPSDSVDQALRIIGGMSDADDRERHVTRSAG